MDVMGQVVERAKRECVIQRLRDYTYLQEMIRQAQATINDLQREMGGLKSPALSDMPHGYDTSDRTYSQVLRLPYTYRRIASITQEMQAAEAEIRKIDDAVRCLNPTERWVIDRRYLLPVSRKMYRALARERMYAESTLMNAHTTAIKKLTRVLQS